MTGGFTNLIGILRTSPLPFQPKGSPTGLVSGNGWTLVPTGASRRTPSLTVYVRELMTAFTQAAIDMPDSQIPGGTS